MSYRRLTQEESGRLRGSMSLQGKTIQTYRLMEQQIRSLRDLHGEDAVEIDALLDRMDGVWAQLSDTERQELNRDRLGAYGRLQNRLRESRRALDWRPEQDREMLAKMEDLYGEMTEEEQGQVEADTWKAWPDLYDARTKPNEQDPSSW
jgi:hypothetical protein